MTSVRSVESVGRSAIASRWPWPFIARDFDQHLFVDDRRSAQQRACDGNFILVRELADQPARRIGQHRQPLGQFGARGKFGMRNETGQDAVEQIDMIGPEVRRALQEQFADPARGIGAALGVATPDDVVEFRGSAMVEVIINPLKPAELADFRAI